MTWDDYTEKVVCFISRDKPLQEAWEIPEEYLKDFPKLFRETTETVLPRHTPYDHKIPLKPGTSPPNRPLYLLSGEKLAALREYLKDCLKKGYIEPSRSPAGAPVILVRKPNGKWRVVVDYRGLNEITIKNRYPLPLIGELMERILKAKYFTKIDLRHGFHLVRIDQEDQWKTAFKTRYGHFEYRVMPFGLTNAPASFQEMTNDVLKPCLDNYAIVYLDDILIYSETLEEHQEHVKEVLGRLQEANLLVAPEKSEFHVQKVKFLGYIWEHGTVKPDPEAIEAIINWEIPTKLVEVQAFLGFTNYYRKFIYQYGTMARPLTDLTKKGVLFKWEEQEKQAFARLKDAITKEPVLRIPDPEKPFELEVDASNVGRGAVLFQRDENGKAHPVAFLSKAWKGAEIRYHTPDQEMLAIVEALMHWKHLLEGAKFPIKIYSDHRNLTYFLKKQNYSNRQLNWRTGLSYFDYQIIPIKGKENSRADALSRRHEAISWNNLVTFLKKRPNGNLEGLEKFINVVFKV